MNNKLISIIGIILILIFCWFCLKGDKPHLNASFDSEEIQDLQIYFEKSNYDLDINDYIICENYNPTNSEKTEYECEYYTIKLKKLIKDMNNK